MLLLLSRVARGGQVCIYRFFIYCAPCSSRQYYWRKLTVIGPIGTVAGSYINSLRDTVFTDSVDDSCNEFRDEFSLTPFDNIDPDNIDPDNNTTVDNEPVPEGRLEPTATCSYP
jgi:hypothetical protein